MAYREAQGAYTGKSGVQIAYRGWVSDKTKSVLVIMHGLGEHSGRYSRVADHLDGRNISVYAFDLEGHGRSEGKRGHADSFLNYVHDLKLLMNRIKAAHPGVPVVLMGHSMGGLVALRYALTYKHDLSSLILSAPAIYPRDRHSALAHFAAGLVRGIAPSATVATGLSPADLTHDETERAAYAADPANHFRISFRLATELFANAQFCLDRAGEIRIPILLLHGSDDPVCDVKGSELLAASFRNPVSRFVVYNGLYHEILNEVEKERMKVLNDVKKWIQGKVSGSEQKSTKSSASDYSEQKAKPAAKKSAKKAVKKAAPKAAKKAVKKAAPKAAKKAVKKAAPKAAKKAVKKAAKKAVKKSGR
jgi:acylglycerol lipase